MEVEVQRTEKEKETQDGASEKTDFCDEDKDEELYEGDIHITRTFVAAKGKKDEVGYLYQCR